MSGPWEPDPIERLPTDYTRQRNSGQSILSYSLNNKWTKFSIGPVNKPGRFYAFSSREMMKFREKNSLGATHKTIFSRPIRDTGGAKHPELSKQYTLQNQRLDSLTLKSEKARDGLGDRSAPYCLARLEVHYLLRAFGLHNISISSCVRKELISNRDDLGGAEPGILNLIHFISYRNLLTLTLGRHFF